MFSSFKPLPKLLPDRKKVPDDLAASAVWQALEYCTGVQHIYKPFIGYPLQHIGKCSLSHRHGSVCDDCLWGKCQFCLTGVPLCPDCGAEAFCSQQCIFVRTQQAVGSGWMGVCKACKGQVIQPMPAAVAASVLGAPPPAAASVQRVLPPPTSSAPGAGKPPSRSASPDVVVISGSPSPTGAKRLPTPPSGGGAKLIPSGGARSPSHSPPADIWQTGRMAGLFSPSPRRKSPSPPPQSPSESPSRQAALDALRAALVDAMAKVGAAGAKSSDDPKLPENYEFDRDENPYEWKKVPIFTDIAFIQDKHVHEVKQVFTMFDEAIKLGKTPTDPPPSSYGPAYSPFTVVSIFRTQNMLSERAYRAIEDGLKQRHKDQPVDITGTVFHGTTDVQAADSICRDGANAKKTETGVYGWGMYFSKGILQPALQHAFRNGSSRGFIVVCDAIVGKREHTRSGMVQNSSGFDSGGNLTNWIHVVFKGAYVNPKYVVQVIKVPHGTENFHNQYEKIMALDDDASGAFAKKDTVQLSAPKGVVTLQFPSSANYAAVSPSYVPTSPSYGGPGSMTPTYSSTGGAAFGGGATLSYGGGTATPRYNPSSPGYTNSSPVYANSSPSQFGGSSTLRWGGASPPRGGSGLGAQSILPPATPPAVAVPAVVNVAAPPPSAVVNVTASALPIPVLSAAPTQRKGGGGTSGVKRTNQTSAAKAGAPAPKRVTAADKAGAKVGASAAKSATPAAKAGASTAKPATPVAVAGAPAAKPATPSGGAGSDTSSSDPDDPTDPDWTKRHRPRRNNKK